MTSDSPDRLDRIERILEAIATHQPQVKRADATPTWLEQHDERMEKIDAKIKRIDVEQEANWQRLDYLTDQLHRLGKQVVL
jgi:hypothetical protein